MEHIIFLAVVSWYFLENLKSTSSYKLHNVACFMMEEYVFYIDSLIFQPG